MANTPHGGELKDLVARDAPIREQLIEESRTLPDIWLNEVSRSHAFSFFERICSLAFCAFSDNYVTWSSFATVASLPWKAS